MNQEVNGDELQSSAQFAHLIKSPLTVLTLQLDELIKSTTDQKLIELSQCALTEVLRINSMIENILITWREATIHESTEIDLNKLLNNLLIRWYPLFRAKNREIILTSAEQIFALGSETLEEQAIEVLIDNSLHHGAGDTKIKLTKNCDWAVIEISDCGPGISDEIQEKLMTYGATTTGTGIGLAWARDQVTADGGRLELVSMKPAVFKLFLKLDPLYQSIGKTVSSGKTQL